MNFSCLYFYPRLDLPLISKVPCFKIQVIKQSFGVLAPPSESASFSRNRLRCAGITLGAILNTFGIT